MKKIRIGQIGVCHEHASAIILSLRGLPDVFEIVGVVDDRASSRAARRINDAYPAGTRTVDFGVQRDRYADHLLEWAKIIRGEMESPYGADHDILVQDVLLASAAYKRWKG